MPKEIIENKVYIIREQRVMLDKDLAWLYGVETKALNQAVKRNPERFPEDFMFQLTQEEFANLKFQNGTSSLRSQFVTSRKDETLISQIAISNEEEILRFQIGTSKKEETRGGQRYLPYAFTEHGVVMLSSVLRSERAVAVNIQIVRIFNKLRNMAIEHKDLRDELTELKDAFIKYARDNNLELEEIYKQLDYLNDITKPAKIGFKSER